MEIIFGIAFFIVFVVAFVSGTKNITASKTDTQPTETEDVFQPAPSTLTLENTEYLNSLRKKKFEKQDASTQKPVAHETETHEHVGEAETYEKIVGSLGEVSDEGCDELDGVRLIAVDELYETDGESDINENVIKAIILGEVLAKPKCKR